MVKMIVNWIKNNIISVAIVLLTVIFSIVIISISQPSKQNPSDVTPTVLPTPSPEIEYYKKEITTEIINEGLNNMGVLITQEYYFTAVTTGDSTDDSDSFWNDVVSFLGAQSSYIISYDGVIYAGIDFDKIIVESKDDQAKVITIIMPKAAILMCDILEDTLHIYDEKKSIFSPFSFEEYSTAHLDINDKAMQMAEERGILDKANENAQTVVENFVKSLIGNEYKVVFK